MTQWLYRRLMVWNNRGEELKKDPAGWYAAVNWLEHYGVPQTALPFQLLWRVASPTAKRDTRRLTLNPERNWEAVTLWEWLTWDEEAGHADLATEVVAELGLEGWELAGVQLGSIPGDGSSSQWPISYYIFKKPVEKPT